MSFSKADAAISFTAYFAGLADEDLLDIHQWDYEKLNELREDAKAILARND